MCNVNILHFIEGQNGRIPGGWEISQWTNNLPAHHQLNISVDIIGRIKKAFSRLADKGMLKQGAGVFEFEDLQIHI